MGLEGLEKGRLIKSGNLPERQESLGGNQPRGARLLPYISPSFILYHLEN